MQRPGSKKRLWNLRKPAGKPMEDRKRDPFYHTARWTRESRMFRQAHPLCRECERKGLIVPSEVTDHIIPKDKCRDPWDKSNWEALCKTCHARKGSRDKKYFRNEHR